MNFDSGLLGLAYLVSGFTTKVFCPYPVESATDIKYVSNHRITRQDISDSGLPKSGIYRIWSDVKSSRAEPSQILNHFAHCVRARQCP